MAADKFDLDRPPAVVWIGLRIIIHRIEVSKIVTDCGKGLLFFLPVFGKERFTAGSGAHSTEYRSGNWLDLGVPGTDHVNGNSLGLSQFIEIFRGNHAG